MSKKDVIDAIGDIDDTLIEEYASYKKRSRWRWIPYEIGAACAVAALVFGLHFWKSGTGSPAPDNPSPGIEADNHGTYSEAPPGTAEDRISSEMPVQTEVVEDIHSPAPAQTKQPSSVDEGSIRADRNHAAQDKNSDSFQKKENHSQTEAPHGEMFAQNEPSSDFTDSSKQEPANEISKEPQMTAKPQVSERPRVTDIPSARPQPSQLPTAKPEVSRRPQTTAAPVPTATPTIKPTVRPTATPDVQPSKEPDELLWNVVTAKNDPYDGTIKRLLAAYPSASPSPEPSKSPAPTKTPGIITPTVSETPAPTGSPYESEAPAPTGEPAMSEAPAPSGSPYESEAPAPTGEPSMSEAPVPSGSPSMSAGPVPSGSPSMSEEPEQSGTPAGSTDIPSPEPSFDPTPGDNAGTPSPEPAKRVAQQLKDRWVGYDASLVKGYDAALLLEPGDTAASASQLYVYLNNKDGQELYIAQERTQSSTLWLANQEKSQEMFSGNLTEYRFCGLPMYFVKNEEGDSYIRFLYKGILVTVWEKKCSDQELLQFVESMITSTS